MFWMVVGGWVSFIFVVPALERNIENYWEKIRMNKAIDKIKSDRK